MSKLLTEQRNELWNRLSDLLAQEGPLYSDELLTNFIDGIERDIIPMAVAASELTDLIGAHVWWPQLNFRSSKCACGWQGEDPEYPSVGHAAHVALVVEQHTNGRITELEERIANAQSLCNATGRYNAARQKHWNIRVFACDVLAALKGRAALEGEQQ